MVLEDLTEIPPGSLNAGWELEACEPDTMHEVTMRGRLKKHTSFGKRKSKPLLLSLIFYISYPLSLSLPLLLEQTINPPVNTPHLYRRVCPSYMYAVHVGCVTEVHTRPYICSPLSVVVGKEWLVINLRHLNITSTGFCGNKNLSISRAVGGGVAGVA